MADDWRKFRVVSVPIRQLETASKQDVKREEMAESQKKAPTPIGQTFPVEICVRPTFISCRLPYFPHFFFCSDW